MPPTEAQGSEHARRHPWMPSSRSSIAWRSPSCGP